ncbi:MAG: GNAT family N-acetyltransferase [Patescibacteria group bacterium]
MGKSTDNLRIRWAEKTDLMKLQKFFSREYNPRHIFTNKKHLKWYFADSPGSENSKFLPAVIAEDSSKKFVGFLGALPVDMWIAGKKYKCGWYANWLTAKEMRGRGIGMKIFHKMTNNYELPLAVSFSNVAYPIYPKNGWEKISQYTRLLAILDPQKAVSIAQAIYPKKNADILKNHNFLLTKGNFKIPVSQLKIVWGIPQRNAWIKAWPVIKQRFGMTTDRSWQYISWRFLKHPFLKYHFATAYDLSGNISGLAVIRVEKANSVSIARVVDIISLPQADYSLIKSVLDFAKKEKCAAIDTYLTFAGYIRAFKKFGFRNGRAWPLYLVPELFNPPAPYSLNPIRWAMLAKLDKLPKNVMPPWEERHFVKANGDRDRA